MTVVVMVVRNLDPDQNSGRLRVDQQAFDGVEEVEVEGLENSLGSWPTERTKSDGACYYQS